MESVCWLSQEGRNRSVFWTSGRGVDSKGPWESEEAGKLSRIEEPELSKDWGIF